MGAATNYAMVVSLTIIFLSFGILMFNELNLSLLTETGGAGVGRTLAVYNTTAFLGYEDLNGLQTNELNGTLNEVGNFQKPENVEFNFDFWKSISILRIMVNMIWTPTIGFASFLISAFNMPTFFYWPITLMINFCNIIFALYVFLGKEF